MKRYMSLLLFMVVLLCAGRCGAALSKPRFFTAARSGNTYTLTWSEVPGALGYILYYRMLSEPSVVHSENMGTATTLSAHVTEPMQLHAAVAPADGAGTGPYSDVLYLDTGIPGDLPETSAIIGSAGGEISVNMPASPLNGAAAVFPAGALGNLCVVDIRSAELPQGPPTGYGSAGPAVEFSSTVEHFSTPVRLVLPYRDLDNDGFLDDTGRSELSAGVWYFNESLGSWEERRVVSRNKIANLVVIETDHFSTYITLAGEDTNTLPDGTGEGFLQGEYFRGDQALGRNGCINQAITINCGAPYYLTVRNTDNSYASGLTAVVDRHVTKWAGIPVTLSADMKSVSFDATELFEKIKASGNADLWKWECDFVAEHTRLVDYVAVSEDDPNPPPTAGGEKIFSKISVDPENLNRVTIDWGVDITNQLNWGNTLAVKFEATYVGVPEAP